MFDEALAGAGTVAELVARVAALLDAADLCFGHGTDNAWDEAMVLVLAAAGLALDDPGAATVRPGAEARRRLAGFVARRIEHREPAPYITGEAWFAGLPFAVDRRVLIPRSPFAELLEVRFEPWLRPGPVAGVLEIGTGSGCIAVAAARAFPEALVVATDIAPGALEVARVNLARHGLTARVALVRTDLCAGLAGPFDLVVTNPPYVPADEAATLPPEYRHEPAGALFAGADGLQLLPAILAGAGRVLAPDGLLAFEVGAGWPAVEALYPRLPVTWVELERGGEGIGLVTAADLAIHCRESS